MSAARSAAAAVRKASRAFSRLAAVPQDRLGEAAGAAVVEQAVVAVDALEQAEAPERRRPPLAAVGRAVGPAVGEAVAHVVEEEIGEGVDGLVAELGQRRVAAGRERRHVAGGAAEAAEERHPVHDLGPLEAARDRHGERAHIGHQPVEEVVGSSGSTGQRARVRAGGLRRPGSS